MVSNLSLVVNLGIILLINGITGKSFGVTLTDTADV